MPKLNLGTPSNVIDALAGVLNEEREDVEMVVYFLYRNDYKTVSTFFESKYRRTRLGFSVSSLQRKIPEIARRMCDKLEKRFNMLDPAVYDCANNSLEPFFDRNVIGSIDTVPVRCWKMNNTYNPKYGGHVLKILVAVANTGVILFTSEPYAGATHDLVIYKHAFQHKAPKDRVFLCDGVFADKATEGIIVPYDMDEIWKEGAAKAHELLRFNEMIAHFRSRVEHRFSGPQMNRFAFMRDLWRREVTNLGVFVRLAAWVINIEIFMRHGPTVGCYPPVGSYTAERIAFLRKKFELHTAMSSRYPEQLALAKAEKKAANKAARAAATAEKKTERLRLKELAKAEKDKIRAEKKKVAAARKTKAAEAKTEAHMKLAKGNAKRKVGGTNTTKRR